MNYLNIKSTKELFEAILTLKDQNQAKRFFGDLLTPAEIKEFANRWQVAQMLDKKVPYETISQATGMSSTTIARIQKWLNGKLGGYKLALNSLHHHTSLAGR